MQKVRFLISFIVISVIVASISGYLGYKKGLEEQQYISFEERILMASLFKDQLDKADYQGAYGNVELLAFTSIEEEKYFYNRLPESYKRMLKELEDFILDKSLGNPATMKISGKELVEKMRRERR